jgi:hypothetical protein
LSEIAGEGFRVREGRFGERAEVPAALAAQIAMFDQVVFDIRKRWEKPPGSWKIFSQLRIRHKSRLTDRQYRLSSRIKIVSIGICEFAAINPGASPDPTQKELSGYHAKDADSNATLRKNRALLLAKRLARRGFSPREQVGELAKILPGVALE